MRILAIETSCDETSVSILENNKILSNVISSQLFHSEWGGVVPEIASREHLKNIALVTEEAFKKASQSLANAGSEKAQLNNSDEIQKTENNLNGSSQLAINSISLNDIDLVAATSHPGLIGALLVGLNYAKGIAASRNIPFVPVNHIQAHLYSVFIENKVEFPFLCLIVSGGHTMLVKVDDFFKHTIIGTTLDDAAGEAFDKGAKMLGLGYPGGAVIDKLGKTGDKNFHKFPISVTKGNEFDFSFSGVKTALMYYLRDLEKSEKGLLVKTPTSRDRLQTTAEKVVGENPDKSGQATNNGNKREINDKLLNDICASYQEAIIKMLYDKTFAAAKKNKIKNIAIVGGVSANSRLKEKFNELTQSGYNIYIPSIQYTMDNAAMIGITAYFMYKNFKDKNYFYRESLNVNAKARLDYERF